ncbi:MAG: hypothetical protein V4850_07395 [Myxococcota bacterium]
MIRTLSLLALFASLPGCIFVLDGEKDCDASASGSVSLTVSAADAGDVSAAVVTFAPAGEPEKPCDNFGATGEYVCGWEVAGDILVRVEAPGYQTFERSVFVEQGECHVVQEHLAVVLAPEDVDCTDVEMASVVATVAGSGGEELRDVSVSWGYRDADMAPQPCSEGSGGSWTCGTEVAGDLEIYADAGGHAGEMASVHVGADECHVITENVAFELDWLPD